MIRVTTGSGAVYEIDTEAKKVRRTAGENSARLSMSDGVWDTYDFFQPYRSNLYPLAVEPSDEVGTIVKGQRVFFHLSGGFFRLSTDVEKVEYDV